MMVMSFGTPVFQSILHLLFPYTCCGCSSDIVSGENLFCIHCLGEMPKTGFEFFHSNPVEKIFWGRADIQTASAHLYFTSGSFIQHSLHLLKYKGRKEIGIYFGECMGKTLKDSNRFCDCDMIVPLPLFKQRENKRGYNQSEMIARGITRYLPIPIVPDVILRPKKTETQTRKSRVERWKNMQTTFKVAKPSAITGKHILLVDDVITTGASLEAVAACVLEVPETKVSIACLAHTVMA